MRGALGRFYGLARVLQSPLGRWLGSQFTWERARLAFFIWRPAKGAAARGVIDSSVTLRAERGSLLAAASQAAAPCGAGGDPCCSGRPARAYLTSTPAPQQAQLASAAALPQAEGASPAGSASVLSGQAVRLSVGDPFLNSIDVAEGPLLSYKEGREKGFIRKARTPEGCWCHVPAWLLLPRHEVAAAAGLGSVGHKGSLGY